MNKWYGKIGYATTVEVEPGYYEEQITEREYYGDVLRRARSLQNSQAGTNDDISISNQFSILADPYANNHIYDMRYIEYQGAKWKITNVDVQFPRLILNVGGLYHDGEQA